MADKKYLNTNTIIYQSKSGAIELKGDVKAETIWATQAQIADLFGIDQSVVSRHVRNVFKDNEVDVKRNMQKMHNAISDKPVAYYSLDVVLAVGYRTNSKVAIEFRQWATLTLRKYIVDGYAINRNRIDNNYREFLKAVDDVRSMLPHDQSLDSEQLLSLITDFAETWLSLDAYDKSELPTAIGTKKEIDLTVDQLVSAIDDLKQNLLALNQASDLFAKERSSQSINSIFANVMQSFGGQDVYGTIEEKSAHLLYFIVKNHPFVDGNKRCGAFAFVWFLTRARLLDKSRINPSSLTALTILVASSDPKDKDKIIPLIISLIRVPGKN